MKKVLIVGTLYEWPELNGKVQLLYAPSLGMAEERLAKNPDIATIVVEGDSMITLSVLLRLGGKVNGSMIVVSNRPFHQREFTQIGVSLVSREKLPEKILEVLGV